MNMTAPAGSTPVAALIGSPVVTVHPDANLHDVADALTNEGIGAVIVGDTHDPSGIVSERDVVIALADRRDPATTRAMDIANTTLIRCDASATVAEVAARMMERYVRHVLVTDEGELVGIVSARDLLGVYATAAMEEDLASELREFWSLPLPRDEGTAL
jgi:CBS domain-containing protein